MHVIYSLQENCGFPRSSFYWIFTSRCHKDWFNNFLVFARKFKNVLLVCTFYLSEPVTRWSKCPSGRSSSFITVIVMFLYLTYINVILFTSRIIKQDGKIVVITPQLESSDITILCEKTQYLPQVIHNYPITRKLQKQPQTRKHYSLMIWIMNEPKTTIHPHPPSGGGGNSCSSSSCCFFLPVTIAMVTGGDGGGFCCCSSPFTSTWSWVVKGTAVVHVRRTPPKCYFQRYRNATERRRRRRRRCCPSLSSSVRLLAVAVRAQSWDALLLVLSLLSEIFGDEACLLFVAD